MQVVLWTSALLGTLLAGSGVADGQQYIFRETVRSPVEPVRVAAQRGIVISVKVQTMTTITFPFPACMASSPDNMYLNSAASISCVRYTFAVGLQASS